MLAFSTFTKGIYMGMLAKEQIILSLLLGFYFQFSIGKFGGHGAFKQPFLEVPRFFVVDEPKVLKQDGYFYIGIFDNSDFSKSIDLMSIMSTWFISERK